MRYQRTIFKKLLLPALALILGAVVSNQSGYFNQSTTPQTVNTRAQLLTPRPQVRGMYSQTAVVTKVIDGDTFDIDTGEKVRLIGIDTPELHHPTKPVQCFGKEAMIKMKELVEGKTVRLEKDVSETDRYGRLLRFVYLENPSISITPIPSGQPNELFVNAFLVQEGYAHAATFPPDVSKADLFRRLEREAMMNNKGLWKSCPAS